MRNLRQLVFLFAAILFLLPLPLIAQPGDPGGDPDVPITGIEILIGAGAAYGVSRKWLRKKQQKG